MKNLLSKRTLSIILAVVLILAALPLSHLFATATPTVNEYDFSPLKVAKVGNINFKFATTTENADGSLSVVVSNDTAKTMTYFAPDLSNGDFFSYKANTYYKITFDYKVTDMEGNYVMIAPVRVGSERHSTTPDVYTDVNKVRRIENDTTFHANNNPADFDETLVVDAVQTDFANYSITVKAPASFSEVSNSTYDDFCFLINSDNKNYSVTLKNLKVFECEDLPSVELINGDGSVYSTLNGFPGDTFSVTDLPKLAPSQKYYANEERTVEFTSGVYGTTEKVYITKTPYNLYYSEKVEVTNQFNDNAASRDTDGNLVINNTGLHTAIFQPSFAGSGFKLKASTHYSITFKYKVTNNDDTYVNIMPFRFSMARVSAGGSSLYSAAIDANVNRRITAKESVPTNLEVMTKLPETAKVEGTNEDFVTYTYNFTTHDSLYHDGVKFDYDDLFIAIRNSSKTSAKKFTVVFKEFEIRETNADSAKVEIYSGTTLEQTLIGFPDEVIQLPALSPMYMYYTDEACTNVFVTGSVFGEGTTKIYINQTSELFIEDFNYAPYTNTEFMEGSALISTLHKHFRYSVPEDGSVINYQIYYKDTANTNSEGVVGSVLGRTGDGYVPVGVMTEGTSFYTLKPGKSYMVEFDYNVESLDATGGGVGEPYTGDNAIKFGIARANNKDIGKEQRIVSMGTTLAGGGESAYNIATVKETGKGHIATGFTVFDWVNDSYSVDTSAWDGLVIVMAGYGKASIDNIRVVPMDETTKTLITFNSNGGSDVCYGNAVMVDNAKTYTLPTPTKDGFYFGGWYIDKEFTTKFDASSYKRTTGVVNLYAKWLGVEVYKIDFENPRYYYEDNELSNRLAGKTYYRHTFVTDPTNSSNKVMKYQLNYAEKVENVFGSAKGPGSGYSSAVLYNPSTLNGLLLTEGDVIKISLRYKVVDVESGNLSMELRTTNPVNSSHLAVSQEYSIYNEMATTDWKTVEVSTQITGIKSEGVHIGNAIALAMSGFGTVLVDDVVVTRYTGYAVGFNTKTDEKRMPIAGKPGESVALPTLSKEGCVFSGWYTDPDYKNKYEGSVYKFNEKAEMLYAKFSLCQIKQDFENYTPSGMQIWDDFCINNPASSEYDFDLVRKGDGSVFRRGDMGYTRQTAIFDDANMPTLEIGETYIFQIWVKPVELFVEGSCISIRHCTDFDKCYSDQEGWAELGYAENEYGKIGKGKQVEEVAFCDEMRLGEWNLVTYEFTALTPYIAIAAPEYNKIAFDDCTITLKGAEGYALDVDDTPEKDEITEEVVKKVIRTDPNHIFETTISGNGGVIAIVIAIVGGAVVIAAGVLLIIFRKKVFARKIKG